LIRGQEFALCARKGVSLVRYHKTQPGTGQKLHVAMTGQEQLELRDVGKEKTWLLFEELSRGRMLWAFWDPVQSFWPARRVREELFNTSFNQFHLYRHALRAAPRF
jgi:hypothetical protein